MVFARKKLLDKYQICSKIGQLRYLSENSLYKKNRTTQGQPLKIVLRDEQKGPNMQKGVN